MHSESVIVVNLTTKQTITHIGLIKRQNGVNNNDRAAYQSTNSSTINEMILTKDKMHTLVSVI